MSLSARCPACATLFKVVPDQLKVSDGWVRCGQCGEVFDAHAPVTVADGNAIRQPEPLPDDIDIALPAVTPSEPVGVVERTEPIMADPPLPEVSLPYSVSPPAVLDVSSDNKPEEVKPDEIPAVGFLADADPVKRRRKTRVRRGMGVTTLLMAACLVVQVAYFQRDRLAASAPALQPALVALCDVVRCTLAPVRQIESVSIDSSSFTQLRPDTFRLSFVLKNEAPMAVAMPALEVTLTDNQDRVVVRRVVLPAEFAPTDQTLAAQGELAGNLVLGLAVDAAEPRSSGITGYRVLAFYP